MRSLDAKNERWVVGGEGLSRRVVVDLLRWAGDEVDAYFATIDLEGPSRVIWAGNGSVPRWFDLCRDLTERWVHQHHIRDALNRPGAHDRFLAEVLETFVWAFPHQYTAHAEDGTVVQIRLGAGRAWHLVRTGRAWSLAPGSAPAPDARLDIPGPMAWRQLTGLSVPGDSLLTSGPEQLVQGLLEVRSIIV